MHENTLLVFILHFHEIMTRGLYTIRLIFEEIVVLNAYKELYIIFYINMDILEVVLIQG